MHRRFDARDLQQPPYGVRVFHLRSTTSDIAVDDRCHRGVGSLPEICNDAESMNHSSFSFASRSVYTHTLSSACKLHSPQFHTPSSSHFSSCPDVNATIFTHFLYVGGIPFTGGLLREGEAHNSPLFCLYIGKVGRSLAQQRSRQIMLKQPTELPD